MSENIQSKALLVNPTPTKRAFIDTGRICSVRCMFCYHKYVPYTGYKTFEELIKEVDRAHSRGDNYIDFTGGEPTLVPYLDEVIRYINNIGMKCCVITSGVTNEARLKRILGAGVDDILLSVHGASTQLHDYLVAFDGARRFQRKLVDLIKSYVSTLRFNVVINQFNYHELADIAELAIMYGAHIVNYINFNPHHAWKQHMNEARDIIADLREVQPALEESIEYLESSNIGVNVRYYPMCRIKEAYRRTICNDLHVLFDPYEWDYFITPKTTEMYLRKGREMSDDTECHDEPCRSCDLFNICGGINRHFNKFTNGTMIDRITDFKGDKNDFYWYRKHNVMTLQERTW